MIVERALSVHLTIFVGKNLEITVFFPLQAHAITLMAKLVYKDGNHNFDNSFTGGSK